LQIILIPLGTIKRSPVDVRIGRGVQLRFLNRGCGSHERFSTGKGICGEISFII